jgi:hypothetical protein
LQYFKLRPLMSLPLPLFVPLFSPFVFFNPLKRAMLVDSIALKAQLKNVKIYQEPCKCFAVFILFLSFCIDRIETRNGQFSREQYYTAKALFRSWKCLVLCFKGKTVAHPHDATSLFGTLSSKVHFRCHLHV